MVLSVLQKAYAHRSTVSNAHILSGFGVWEPKRDASGKVYWINDLLHKITWSPPGLAPDVPGNTSIGAPGTPAPGTESAAAWDNEAIQGVLGRFSGEAVILWRGMAPVLNNTNEEQVMSDLEGGKLATELASSGLSPYQGQVRVTMSLYRTDSFAPSKQCSCWHTFGRARLLSRLLSCVCTCVCLLFLLHMS